MVKIIVTAFFSQYINLILLLLLLLFTWNTSFNFHITKFHDPESNSGVCVCVVINFFVQLYIDLSTFWSYIDHDETIYLNDRNIILLGTHSIRLIEFFFLQSHHHYRIDQCRIFQKKIFHIYSIFDLNKFKFYSSVI